MLLTEHRKPLSAFHPLYAALAACFLTVPLANAQTESEDEAPYALELEEVVVTVERKTQSLQNLAGTAASFSGEDLKSLGVQNFQDLDGSLPGLSVANNGGNIEVYIRGIGSSNNGMTPRGVVPPAPGRWLGISVRNDCVFGTR